jgi:hypothetical protein
MSLERLTFCPKMGGISGGRPLNEADAFEVSANRSLGDVIRENDQVARALWSALANMAWRHVNGDVAAYSWRAAGDMIAAIRGDGDYMDWYCEGKPGQISDDVRAALRKEGWSPDPEFYMHLERGALR